MPQVARKLSRLLVCAGQSAFDAASVQSMRYHDIRLHMQNHFRDLLKDIKEDVSTNGQITGNRLDSLRAAQGLTDGPLDDFMETPMATSTEQAS